MQAMALYAADSIFTEGYLTTPGQTTKDAWQMIEDLGFEIEVVDDEAAWPTPAPARPKLRVSVE